MIIGACYIELYLHEAQSLKGKRQILRSLKDRLREKFNLAVAEVGSQDLWQRADLGVACVGSDQRYLNGQLDLVINFIRSFGMVELLTYEIQFF